MGLDMYLYRKSYIKNWSHMKAAEKHKISIKRGGKLRADIDVNKIVYIVEEVAYWRKANAIHGWFVQHVQEGTDDCRTYSVSSDQLAELVDLCEEVLNAINTVRAETDTGTSGQDDGTIELGSNGELGAEQKAVAERLLATKSGFFFGSTAYNEEYISDLRETVAQLKPYVGDTDAEFEYRASW